MEPATQMLVALVVLAALAILTLVHLSMNVIAAIRQCLQALAYLYGLYSYCIPLVVLCYIVWKEFPLVTEWLVVPLMQTAADSRKWKEFGLWAYDVITPWVKMLEKTMQSPQKSETPV